MNPLVALDQDAPLPVQVAAFLLERAPQPIADLGDTLVIVPTSGAARAIRHELGRRGVLSPSFRLPMDALLPAGAPAASRLEREATWAMVLGSENRKSFRALVPESVELNSPDDMLGVAARLCNVCDQLGEAGKDPSSPLLGDNSGDDSPRWQALAKIYPRYLEALSRHGLRDPNDLRIGQMREPVVLPGITRVIVACVSDLPWIAEQYLAALKERGVAVDVLAWSPSGQHSHLDAWGRPGSACSARSDGAGWWRSHTPQVPEACLVAANDPATEAGLLLDYAGDNKTGGCALFSAAPESSVALAQEIAWRGVQPHLPEGRPLAQTESAAILLGWNEFARTRRLRELRALLQKPSFLSFFVASVGKSAHFGADDALAACDRLIGDRLCETIDAASDWLQQAGGALNAKDQRPRRQAQEFVMTAAKLLASDVDGEGVLMAVSKHRGDVESGSATARELEAMAEVTGQITDSKILSSLPAELREAVVRADIARKRIFPRAVADAIEVQGWLEAPWSAAASIVVAGCREGALPSGTHEDSFLPDGARAALGLVTQDARFARDAYLLSCLLASRSPARIRLGFSRLRNQGEPNRPSRLLFGCPDSELPQRSQLLFQPSPRARRKEGKNSGFKLQIPRPQPSQWPVESIRVTGFKSYLECPLRFYLAHVLGLRKVDPDAREMPATDFGTVMHKVFEECASDEAFLASTDAEEIARLLSCRLDDVTPRYFGGSPSPVVRVQIENMRSRLKAAAMTEAQIHRDGWQTLAVEHQVKKGDNHALGGLCITGTMDRVERHPVHGLRILDYKTFAQPKNPEKTHIGPRRSRNHIPEAEFEMSTPKGKPVPRSWMDLQLPLYVWLARRIWPEDAGRGMQVGYFLLPAEADDRKPGIELFALDETMEASAVRCAARIAELVKRGCFWPPSSAGEVEFDDFEDWFMGGDPSRIIDAESIRMLQGNP